MSRVTAAAFSLFVFAALAPAQVPTSGNVYFGYSDFNSDLSPISRSNLSGWEGSLEGKVLPMIGIVADLSGNYGSASFPTLCPEPTCPNQSVSVHEFNALFGPRFFLPIGKFRLFVESEFGVGHISTDNLGTDTCFALAEGGGVDYKIMRALAWRFEGDYVSTRFFSTGQTNARLTTGIVIRF